LQGAATHIHHPTNFARRGHAQGRLPSRRRRYFLAENLVDSRAEFLFHYKEEVLVAVEDVEEADAISVEEFRDDSRYPRGTRIGIPS